MAEALKMSQTGYGKIERDETDINYSHLEQIAEVLAIMGIFMLTKKQWKEKETFMKLKFNN